MSHPRCFPYRGLKSSGRVASALSRIPLVMLSSMLERTLLLSVMGPISSWSFRLSQAASGRLTNRSSAEGQSSSLERSASSWRGPSSQKICGGGDSPTAAYAWRKKASACGSSTGSVESWVRMNVWAKWAASAFRCAGVSSARFGG